MGCNKDILVNPPLFLCSFSKSQMADRSCLTLHWCMFTQIKAAANNQLSDNSFSQKVSSAMLACPFILDSITIYITGSLVQQWWINLDPHSHITSMLNKATSVPGLKVMFEKDKFKELKNSFKCGIQHRFWFQASKIWSKY